MEGRINGKKSVLSLEWYRDGVMHSESGDDDGNLLGAAAPALETSPQNDVWPEGQADWLVHEVAHRDLPLCIETILERVDRVAADDALL